MRKKITFILITLLFLLETFPVFAISPKTQFPSEEKTALSLISDLLDSTSLDFKPQKEDTKATNTKKTIQRKHKNPYRNIFYYYGILYGSLSPIGSSYRTVYNNFLARSAYSMPVQKITQSQKPRNIKRFDLFFPQNSPNINIQTNKTTQKNDTFIPGEALTILDLMQKEFESTFFTNTTEQATAKLNILKKAMTLLNKSLSQKKQSRAIAAYENNSSNVNSQTNLFIIRAFIQTMINKMESKINIHYNQNAVQNLRTSA